LTPDAHLPLPDPAQEAVRTFAIAAVSHSAKVDPPPPRSLSLSI
jgi:hypothetical protein